jgi:hypothetical protein
LVGNRQAEQHSGLDQEYDEALGRVEGSCQQSAAPPRHNVHSVQKPAQSSPLRTDPGQVDEGHINGQIAQGLGQSR